MLNFSVALSFFLFGDASFASSLAACSWMLEEHIEKFDEIGTAKRLNLAKVNRYLESLKNEPGVTVEKIAEPYGFPVHMVRIAATKPGAMRVLLTVGVHGNEPIGVTAGLQVMESFLSSSRLRENFDLTFVMVNPPRLGKGAKAGAGNRQGPQSGFFGCLAG